jgi:hypothetical protein
VQLIARYQVTRLESINVFDKDHYKGDKTWYNRDPDQMRYFRAFCLSMSPLASMNRVLRVLKLRTMRVEAEDRSGEARTVKNDPRGTRLLCRILHGLSLDKPRQIFNVLKEERVFGLAVDGVVARQPRHYDKSKGYGLRYSPRLS